VPQSLVQIYVHIVYSTKHRKPFLKDKEFRDRTQRYLAGTCKGLNCPALIVGGVEDHVHILCRFGKNVGIADLIQIGEGGATAAGKFSLAAGIRRVFDQPVARWGTQGLHPASRGPPSPRNVSGRVSTIVQEIRAGD
jgi:hypothetical protein